MENQVTLPFWQFAIIAVLAAWALLFHLLAPCVNWFLRRKVNRMIDELNTRLQLKIPPFKLTKRQALVDRLTYDPEVMAAAEEYAKERNLPVADGLSKAGLYAREIVPSFNAYAYFRVAYFLARWTAGMLYRVQLGAGRSHSELEEINPDSSVVFVMNHRSNIDYILVAYLVATKSAVSYAVGEWARIWPLQTLIQSLGAFFIRRGGSNTLYRRVLSRYVRMAIEGGVTQAVYLEGKLTKDGTIQPPRLGLLGYMLTGYSPKSQKDILFVPVGINYDRALEDRSLTRSLDPEAKRRGLFFVSYTTASFILKNLLLIVTRRWHSFGYAGVNFGRPVSVKKWMEERNADFSGLEKEEFFSQVEGFAQELMAEVKRVVPVLPVSLVSTVLAGAGEEGIGRLELFSRTHRLIEALEKNGVEVYIPREDMDYAVTTGLRSLVLRRLVSEAEGMLFVNKESLHIIRYYANSIAHLVSEAEKGEVSH